ncbi:methyl-accepting chemotaxis protein [Paraburkholderia tuberum]|nr:methyl-accepting chemotaxis protein [Paraburkholderia tuberum]
MAIAKRSETLKYCAVQSITGKRMLHERYSMQHMMSTGPTEKNMGVRTLNANLRAMMALLILGLLAVAGTESGLNRMSLMEGRKVALQQEVETAMSAAERWKQLADSGAISQSDAKSNAISELRAMRYGADGSGYFGIYDSNAVRILNPTNPKLENQSAAGSTDPNGKHVALEVIRSNDPGANHLTQYQWPHPGQTKPVDKLVYSAYLPTWDWHVYTGAYVDDIDTTFERDLIKGLASVILVGFLLSGVMLLLIRSVSRSLGGDPAVAAAVAQEIARGNLLVDVKVPFSGGVSLMSSLAEMRDRLTAIVQGIKTSSESISVAAGEIAQGTTDLSQRTEEQAASLEETASSMEELTATVRQNADNAKQATALASTASGIAQRGGEVIGRVVETMHGISDSSAKVTEIISVIEGIAFQTNILALNAAVEAARAGEQGRGFAVVAGEVRTLAQRSATAAKEIKELIGESVTRVDAGSKLVEEAGSTIKEIVQSVQRVTDIMSEIAAASEEQSTGIGQVNTAVTQMDEATQQNAALVEEASAAAQSMAQQAQGLRDAVAVFKVDDGRASASRVIAPPSEPRRPAPKVLTSHPAALTRRETAPLTTPKRNTLASSGTSAEDWQAF